VTDPVKLLDFVTEQGVVLWAEGSRLRFRASKGIITESMRSQLLARKDSVLAAWRERAAQSVISHSATHGQRALWFLDQSNPGSAAYNVVFSARVRSEVDISALRRSFQALLDRHPSLRTSFRQEADSLIQRVHGNMQPSFKVHDRRGVALPVLREEVRQASQTPFDLENGPLMRVDLFTRAADDQILLFTVHHIAADGWSLFLLLDDLRQIYPAEREGNVALPPRPAHDIVEYSRWQEAMLTGPEGQEHEAYWLKKLEGTLSPLSISTDRPRLDSSSELGASLPMDLGSELSGAVRTLAAKEGATPFVVLLTAYQTLLHRYTGQHEVIVGSPTYGRDRAEFADVVGDFINMIPLKATFHGDPPFRDLLGWIRQAVVEGIQHQDYPFPLLVKKLQPDRDSSRTPVFQTVFILQKFKGVAGLEALFTHMEPGTRAEFGGLVLEPFPIPQQEGQFELSLEMAEIDGVFQGTVKYDASLFEAATIQRLANHYVTLLRAIVAAPETRVSRLALLSSEEREELTVGLNATEKPYPGNRTVVDLIGDQVARRPDAIAVSFEGAWLTYRELDVQSTRLARYLRASGVESESLVCLFLERGLEMVVGVLAVLKAGGAYLPLDPAFPLERLRYMVEDSRAKLLMTQRALSDALFSGPDLVRVSLDEEKDQIDQQSSEPLPPLAKPSKRAYVIYTSGSTGRPKGVEIEHRALTNFLCSMAQEPGLQETDVLLAVTTLSFDIAGLELFLPLITGARIELASRETARDGVALVRTISTSRATVLQATPATWRMLFEWGWKGDHRLKVLCGGEAMDRDLAARLVSTCGQVWNMYGPTETTIWSSVARIESEEVTVGRPIANTRMYVLDEHAEPMPRGAVGELWIGGDGVARGYLNRADLTGERFVANPFHEGERMYRTGDLARRLFDGRIECLGRIDSQVKIRGYRIELREIETALSSHASIRDCVAVARKENTDGVRLVAYMVPIGLHRPEVEDLRTYLQAILPDYMIPSAFVFIDAIPLTPNGKVDRDALPVPENDRANSNIDYVPPRNQVERVLAEIWSEVLDVKQVGVFDHFFELGGHSLSATRLITRIQSKFQIELPLRIIFIEPTIGGMSKHILYDHIAKRYQYVSQVRHWNRLMPAQPMGSRIPFFLVAGFLDADDILRILSNLIPHLGLDQPVFGFQPRWFDGHSERYSSVEEAASEFLAELRAFQPEGPYLLGGDCTGGIVALAMAQELLRQGEDVRLLVLFDTQRPTAFSSFAINLNLGMRRVRHIASVIGQIIRGSVRSNAQLLRDLGRRKLRSIQRKTVADESAADRIIRMSIDYIRAIYRYRVKKYPGRLNLIVNEELYESNKSMGWNGVAMGGLEIHRTPGGHLTRYELHSKDLAKQLTECLERAQAGSGEQESFSSNGSNNGTGMKKPDILLCAATIVSAITSAL
jgi:amino acid adenylation domain-containing protein